jgi:protocatechuate 3,4-dioxygenase beta subunit
MLRATPSTGDRYRRLDGAIWRPDVTRRSVLKATAAVAGAGLAGSLTLALGQQPPPRPTDDQTSGPFYPAKKPADQDADLTQVSGKDGRALGQILLVSGKVINIRGEPVAGAELEVWQANAAGRYNHPSDRNPAPIDPNFQGYAAIRSGADGSYSLKTVKPGAYSMRPPHIHFDVKGRINRLVTQMYFEREPLNDKDAILQGASWKEGLISRYVAPSGAQEPNTLATVWNIVLVAG